MSEGYPTTTALLAAHNGAGLSMPYLSFGGFSATAGLTVLTRLNNPDEIRVAAKPESILGNSDWTDLARYRAARQERLASGPNLMPRAARNRDLYSRAIQPEATEGLRAFSDMLPEGDELQPVEMVPTAGGSRRSVLKRQAQLTVLAFKAGVAVSADLYLGGFDTHDAHDLEQGGLLANLTDSVDYLWDQAELQGVADRMVVVMGSDFGRTNKYNADAGKDHWPIGSFIVMEKNQSWTNRVIGETDELHFARKVNPTTLQRDDAAGTLIYPKHIHKALRQYLGIGNSAESRLFPFSNAETLPFFG